MGNNGKIILLAVICFILGTSEFVIVGVLDKIAATTHLTIPQAGQLITVFALTISVGTPFAIYFTSRYNERKILMVALSFVVASCIMMVISNTYLLFLLSRVFMAIGAGVFNVLCFIVATKLAPEEKRGRAVATVTLGFNAALIVGLPIGRIVTALFGWQAIFVFTAVLGFISIFMVWKLIPAFEGQPPTAFRDQVKLLVKPRIVLSLLMSFFWILGYSVLYSYITPYLQHRTVITEGLLSTTFLIFGIATLAGNRSGGVLGDRIGIPKTILISMCMNVSALIILSLLGGSLYLTLGMLIIWGFAAWLPGPLFRYNIITLAPESPGVMLSLYNSIVQLGLATGAALGGVQIEKFDAVMLSWSAAGSVFIALLLAIIFARNSIKETSIAQPLTSN
jgi:DHA1 family putative efflux transporter-like MFS transporter